MWWATKKIWKNIDKFLLPLLKNMPKGSDANRCIFNLHSSIGASFCEVSAKTNDGIYQLFLIFNQQKVWHNYLIPLHKIWLVNLLRRQQKLILDLKNLVVVVVFFEIYKVTPNIYNSL